MVLQHRNDVRVFGVSIEINEAGKMKGEKKTITNACWVWVEVLHAMAIVAISLTVVGHIWQSIVEWMVVSLFLAGQASGHSACLCVPYVVAS